MCFDKSHLHAGLFADGRKGHGEGFCATVAKQPDVGKGAGHDVAHIVHLEGHGGIGRTFCHARRTAHEAAVHGVETVDTLCAGRTKTGRFQADCFGQTVHRHIGTELQPPAGGHHHDGRPDIDILPILHEEAFHKSGLLCHHSLATGGLMTTGGFVGQTGFFKLQAHLHIFFFRHDAVGQERLGTLHLGLGCLIFGLGHGHGIGLGQSVGTDHGHGLTSPDGSPLGKVHRREPDYAALQGREGLFVAYGRADAAGHGQCGVEG